MSATADIDESRSLIREAFPVTKHGKAVNSWFVAARKLGLNTVGRAECIWKGSARRIDAWEMDALRAAAIKQRERDRDEADRRIQALRRGAETRLASMGSSTAG
ncbi:hypothetical protein [Ahrensia sp. R2A130]|uniref:hypothetical protein n=1 Tax=Ahrensia sp. R2A130 TaxID=744979 RepID=UPI0001E0BCB4|nr:hypothetical protein [Ahrensia sp. R2A130]EFL88316.1 conserved hypothetical protein [Ahrensia sp. R2A130]